MPLGPPTLNWSVYFQGQLVQSDAMNARTDQVLIEKLNAHAPQQRAEVEDFVDFLKARRECDRDDAARRLGEAFAKLDALNSPPVSPQDVQAEIEAARAARLARDADRR